MWPLKMSQIYEYIFHKPCQNEKWKSIEIQSISTNSREIENNQLFIAIEGDKFDGHQYINSAFENGSTFAIINKDSKYYKNIQDKYKHFCLEVDDTIETFREFSKSFRKNFSFPVFGIGGSNGKTTTKEFLSAMLSGKNLKILKTEKSENGFLGVAVTLTQKGLRQESAPNYLVVEIGIDDIGAMEKHMDIVHPNIVLLTALGPEHLTGLKTWEIGIREEMFLFSYKNTIRIWQLDDDKIYEQYLTHKLSKKNDFFVFEKNKRKIIEENIFEYEVLKIESFQSEINIYSKNKDKIKFNVPLPGRHNISNFVLSYATAKSLSISNENIFEGFKKFIPPKMRSEVKNLDSTTILYNDSYNSSPKSLEMGLQTIQIPEWKNKNKTIILGDMLELDEGSIYWHENASNNILQLENSDLFFCGPFMYYCYRKLKSNHEHELVEKNLNAHHFLSVDDLLLYFQKNDFDFKNQILFLKGSRGMHLEKIVEFIEKKFSF